MALATDSPWQAIASAALLGTGRQPFQPPITPDSVGQVLAQLTDRSAEAALLSATATVAVHQRVGWLPETQAAPPLEPCPTDDLPRCSTRAAYGLQQLLQGQYPHLLPEWLDRAAIAGQRVPEIRLPALLDKGRQQRDLRAAILPVLGQRGRWLAAHNPDWSYAVTLTTEADWETGTAAARVLYLETLRAIAPDRAREMLQTTWNQESAGDRTKFLETLQVGLSLTDEPFLEATLGDRSKDVRRTAADLLARLPDSHLCQQIAAHTCRYLSMQHPATLEVQLPDQLDETLPHLGIDPKLSGSASSKLGEKAWWLLQLIGATPLSTWTKRWQMSPQAIVDLAKDHDWHSVLLDGFALAAKRQNNPVWLEAILRFWVTGLTAMRRKVALISLHTEALIDDLPGDRRDALLIDLFQVFHKPINDSIMVWLLRSSAQQWSLDLTRLVLHHLENHMNATPTVSNTSDWELRTALKEFAQLIPPRCIPEVVQLQKQLPQNSLWQQSVDEWLATLQFRQEMIEAFGVGKKEEKREKKEEGREKKE